MKVRDIMSSNIEYVSEQDDASTTARKMRDIGVGAMPVVNDQEQLSGIVTDRDIVVRAIAEGRDPVMTPIREIMTPGAISCSADMTVEEAAELMEAEQIRRLVVVDTDAAVGILSLGDLAVKTPGSNLAGEAVAEISKPALPKRK